MTLDISRLKQTEKEIREARDEFEQKVVELTTELLKANGPLH